MYKFWRGYRYKNLSFLALSIIIAVFLFESESLHSWLIHLGGLGYFGAFLAGALFVSTFTFASAAIVLLILAESLPLLPLGIIAGAGAMFGDLVIFNTVRNNDLDDEVKQLFDFFNWKKISHLMHTKYFAWTLPVVGAVLIASPLPDEVGISLMGISKLKTYQFLVISFLLNSVGIVAVILASTVIRP